MPGDHRQCSVVHVDGPEDTVGWCDDQTEFLFAIDLILDGLERMRDFGNAWLALGLWRLLGLDELLSQRMEAGQEEVPWPVVASISWAFTRI